MAKKCSFCGGTNFGEDLKTGEKYCTGCGLVQDDSDLQISYGSSQSVARKGITTLIGVSDPLLRSTYTINSSERSANIANELITQWGIALSLPETTKMMANDLYESLRSKKLTQGRRIEELAAGCLHIASRLTYPRPLKSLEDISLLQAKVILKNAKYISQSLKVSYNMAKPEDFVPFFCGRLRRGFDVEVKAKEIIKECPQKATNPRVIAAASVYYASILTGQPILLEECSAKTKTTLISLKTAVKFLKLNGDK